MTIPGVTDFSLRANTAKGSQSIDMNAFMTLLTVQLTTQNPLEPMNDRDFFAQLAQLGTVQGLDNLKGGISSVKNSMQMVEASNLIGKTISAERVDAGTGGTTKISGKVERVFLQGGKFYLDVMDAATNKKVELPVDAVLSVKA